MLFIQMISVKLALYEDVLQTLMYRHSRIALFVIIFKGMLNHLKEKKDVGFFTSIAGLMNSCSVLDLDAFERNTKAEGLGVGSEGAAGEKNMHDAEFTCALFRFIQLTCEGHNLGKIMQYVKNNYNLKY